MKRIWSYFLQGESQTDHMVSFMWHRSLQNGLWATDLSESLWLSQFHFTTSEVSQHFSSPPQHPHIPQLPLLSDAHPGLGMYFDRFEGPLHMVPFYLISLPCISVLYWWKSPSGLHCTSSVDKTALLPASSLTKFVAMRCWSSALLYAEQEWPPKCMARHLFW